MWLHLVVVTTLVANSLALQVCQKGWTLHEGDGSCLRLFGKKSFDMANRTCVNYGGQLATIRDSAKNTFIKDVVSGNQNVWIGLISVMENYRFSYVDGYYLSPYYKPWKRGEPSATEGEYCGMLNGRGAASGYWTNEQCDHSHHFVCEQEAQTMVCADKWVMYEGDRTCLNFNDPKPYQGAKDHCKSLGAELVIIQDDAKNTFTKDFVPDDRHLWIGVESINRDNTFTYADGKPVTYKGWYKEQPFRNGQYCGMLNGWGSHRGKWTKENCSASKFFVCQKTAKTISCPKTWTMYEKDENCLKAFGVLKDYYDAQRHCKNYGGNLVVIRDHDKNKVVKDMVPGNKNTWVGVVRDTVKQIFRYSNRQPATFLPWAPGGTKSSLSCALMLGRGDNAGKWNKQNCASVNTFVCQRPASTLECQEGWTLYYPDRMCTKVHPEKRNFTSARDSCGKNSGDLVRIYDQTKNQFIEDLADAVVPGRHLWMGIADPEHNQHYRYINGDKFWTYTNWNSGEPNNFGNYEKCGMFIGNGPGKGKWNDAHCGYGYPFVCERPALVLKCYPGWTISPSDNTCLREYSKRHFFNAMSVCNQTRHSQLVIIKDTQKNMYTAGMMTLGDRFWIGVWTNFGHRVYINGESLVYENWKNPVHNQYFVSMYSQGSAKGKWLDGPGEEELPLMCQEPIQSVSCPYSWTLYEEEVVCLKAFNPRSFDDAERYCESLDYYGTLVIIRDPTKNAFTLELMHRAYHYDFWIGAKRVDGVYKHINEQDFGAYKPWAKGEPSDHNEYCVQMYGWRPGGIGQWNNARCSNRIPFVCERPAIYQDHN